MCIKKSYLSGIRLHARSIIVERLIILARRHFHCYSLCYAPLPEFIESWYPQPSITYPQCSTMQNSPEDLHKPMSLPFSKHQSRMHAFFLVSHYLLERPQIIKHLPKTFVLLRSLRNAFTHTPELQHALIRRLSTHSTGLWLTPN